MFFFIIIIIVIIGIIIRISLAARVHVDMLQYKLEGSAEGDEGRAGDNRGRAGQAVLHRRWIVAVEDVHKDARRCGVASLAGVVARVTARGARHFEPRFPGREVRAHVHALLHVVVDHAVVVVPEEEERLLRRLLHHAVQL